MWPWEHAVIGYVAFSLLVHLFLHRSPTGRETGVFVLASVLPDLVDKPLAWQFGVFESGYALGHSVFFAVPLSITAFLVAARYDRPTLGGAFGVGYLLHLPFDVIPHLLRSGWFPIERVLWPVTRAEPSHQGGFVDTFDGYFQRYLAELLSGDPTGYTVAVLGMIAFSIALWAYDGFPGLREPLDYLGERFATEPPNGKRGGT